MRVFDFSDEEMRMLTGLASDRRRLALVRNARSYTGDRRDGDDLLGIMGEYALLKLCRLPLYRWNALWSLDLPDVDDMEVRTRSTYGYDLGVKCKTLDQVADTQRFVQCYASIEHRTATVAGWAYAFTIREQGFEHPGGGWRRLSPDHFESVDLL